MNCEQTLSITPNLKIKEALKKGRLKRFKRRFHVD